MNLVERIQYIMKLNQLNVSAFADEIGVQRSSVSHVLSGRNKPSLDFVQKIIKRYPKVDSGWLINGTTNVVPKEDRIFPETNESIPDKTKPVEQKVDLNAVTSDRIKEELDTVPNSDQMLPKKIQRILIFYNDQTFEEFKP